MPAIRSLQDPRQFVRTDTVPVSSKVDCTYNGIAYFVSSSAGQAYAGATGVLY